MIGFHVVEKGGCGVGGVSRPDEWPQPLVLAGVMHVEEAHHPGDVVGDGSSAGVVGIRRCSDDEAGSLQVPS